MFWMLPLAGAALGALASKKDPLKGAMMGAALGATGGAGAGLLGAGGAATGAATGGLLSGGATTAGALAGDAFMPAALSAGGSEVAMGAAIPGLTPSGYTAGGLLGTAAQAAKPVMQAASVAQQSGLMGGESQPVPQAQARQNAPLDLSSIFQANNQAQANESEEDARRRKELEQYAMNMMGGLNG